jgi:hypothetical protein
MCLLKSLALPYHRPFRQQIETYFARLHNFQYIDFTNSASYKPSRYRSKGQVKTRMNPDCVLLEV